jgi:glycine cleavage system H lipoate-binding protein
MAKGLDQYVSIHMSGIAVVGLAPYHPIRRFNKVISLINFDVNDKDRSKVQVSGKRKRGAMWVHSDTALVHVHCKALEEVKSSTPDQIQIDETNNNDNNNQRHSSININAEEKFVVRAVVSGKLVETNENLESNMQLLCQAADSMGFIAIIIVARKQIDYILQSLMSKKEYFKTRFGQHS